MRERMESPSNRHRSMKCSCAAERSFNSDARHFAINAPGVIVPIEPGRPLHDEDRLAQLNGARAPPAPNSVLLWCSRQDA